MTMPLGSEAPPAPQWSPAGAMITRRVDPPTNMPAVRNGSFIWFNSLADRWTRVLCAACRVTTSPVVKLRNPCWQITDNVHTVFQYGGRGTIGASSTVGVSFAPGSFDSMSVVGGTDLAIGIPDLWLPPGWVVVGGLLNFDTGDVCSDAHMLVQEVPADLVLATNGDQPPPS